MNPYIRFHGVKLRSSSRADSSSDTVDNLLSSVDSIVEWREDVTNHVMIWSAAGITTPKTGKVKGPPGSGDDAVIAGTNRVNRWCSQNCWNDYYYYHDAVF